MRILIVTSYFPPLNSIASLRPYSWAQYWPAAGRDVTVITPYRSEEPSTALTMSLSGFKILKTPPIPWLEKLKSDYRQHDPDPVKPDSLFHRTLRRAFATIRQRKGILAGSHMPDFTDLWVPQAMKTLRDARPWDIVVTTAPPFSVHRLGYKIKRAGLAKYWIADFRDLIVDSPITPGLWPFSTLERWLERRYMRHIDLTTTVSDGLATSLLSNYPKAQVRVIENGYEPADMQQLSTRSAFPQDNQFRLVYLGTIYPGKRDPSLLFQAIKEISQDDTQRHLLDRLEVLFYGPEMGDVPDLIARYQVDQWVIVKGFVKREESLRIQRDADALLFISWSDPTVEGILTGKLFEYLSCGTPIVAIGGPRPDIAEKLIIDTEAGEVLGTDISAIRQYLVTKLASREKTDKEPRHTKLQAYTRQALAEKMLAMFPLEE